MLRCSIAGRYTLDVYLIQIILIECILGTFYRLYLMSCIGVSSMIIQSLCSFVVSIILFVLIMKISSLINKHRYLAKLLFYRSN